jgi:hypothetical protein
VSPAQVAELLGLVEEGTISGKQAKEVLAAIAGHRRAPADVVRERGMAVIRRRDALEAPGARELVAESPKQAAQYRAARRPARLLRRPDHEGDAAAARVLAETFSPISDARFGARTAVFAA